jgi:tetratricopeptide (TPR) repeat protein
MISTRRYFGLLIVVASLVAGLHTASAQVKVWEGTFKIPVYEEGPPNPNPPFDQYNRNTNYPYTLRYELTNQRNDHDLRAVFLENEYLKCTVLPDLGGHIYTCIDKLSNQPMFYANPSIKKADIGYRGSWAAFGEEFNFPVSHNWITLSPIDFSYAKNADGSGSIFIGNTDRVYGTQYLVEMILRPGSTVLETKVTLANRADVRHRYYWWSNAGVQVWDDSRITYPMRFSQAHGFADIDTWPVDSSGTDVSILKNQIYGPVSRFIYASAEPYNGIWHPHTNTGIVHYAPFKDLPGRKIWSFASDADGLDWRKTLSDNDSAYMEVQAGVFRNQETYAFLEPRQTIHFSEYWMPARDLGGFVRANLNGVLNLSRKDNALEVAFNANQAFPGSTVRIFDGSNEVLSEKQDLAPERTWKHEIASADSQKKYTVDILDASGAVLMHQVEGEYDWTPKEDVHVGKQQHFPMPAAAERTEDDWVQFAKDQELNGARLPAMKDYKEALEKFPTSYSLQLAAGRLSADLLHYDDAIKYLAPVEARETSNPEPSYYLGIAYDALGREREARISYGEALRVPEFHAAGSLRLAELEARQGHLQAAANDLAEALKSAGDDLRSAEELVAVENALSQTDAATTLAKQWLARYPTSYFLREELGNPDNAHLAADSERVLNIASEYMRLGLYEKALGVLSRTYPQVPADQQEPANALPQDNPLVVYYRAYCEQKLGRSTADDYATAAKLSTKYIFPSGAISYKVLQSAVAANPDDANASYLLGTLEFSVDMTDAGLEHWKHAQQLHPQIPSLDRDIGQALLQLKEDAEGALAAYQRGVNGDDPNNLDNYFGLDQTLSMLNHPAAERVAALGHYPDLKSMPTDLFYEYVLTMAEAGDYDRAESLFHDRFFVRAEGGTNVRQVWVEVRLLHAVALAKEGHCDAALPIASQLGAAVPGLDFTQDGMQTFLESARTEYLLGEIESGCGHADAANKHYELAAGSKGQGQVVWAAKAAKKLGNYDDAKWHAMLLRAATPRGNGGNEGSSIGSYYSGMAQLELGNKAAADADLRKTFMKPDRSLAYHLSRLALAGENN